MARTKQSVKPVKHSKEGKGNKQPLRSQHQHAKSKSKRMSATAAPEVKRKRKSPRGLSNLRKAFWDLVNASSEGHLMTDTAMKRIIRRYLNNSSDPKIRMLRMTKAFLLSMHDISEAVMTDGLELVNDLLVAGPRAAKTIQFRHIHAAYNRHRRSNPKSYPLSMDTVESFLRLCDIPEATGSITLQRDRFPVSKARPKPEDSDKRVVDAA